MRLRRLPSTWMVTLPPALIRWSNRAAWSGVEIDSLLTPTITSVLCRPRSAKILPASMGAIRIPDGCPCDCAGLTATCCKTDRGLREIPRPLADRGGGSDFCLWAASGSCYDQCQLCKRRSELQPLPGRQPSYAARCSPDHLLGSVRFMAIITSLPPVPTRIRSRMIFLMRRPPARSPSFNCVLNLCS